MITMSNFIGAIMQALTASRMMSDHSSLKVADHYLQDDFLRGFPIPRMTLKTVDVEVNFAVGPTTQLENHLAEPEVSKNIANRFRDLLAELPNTHLFRSEFGQQERRSDEWKEGTETLMSDIERILAHPPADKHSLQHMLVLSIENFFYRMHQNKPKAGLLHGLRRMFGNADAETESPAPDADRQTDAIRTWTSEQVRHILDASIPGGLDKTEDSPDLRILIGGQDLDTKDIGKLHKAKLSFTSEDRRWVATDKDGEKSYMLDR